MNCPYCKMPMGLGAPHSETIKMQWECGECGRIETENYTREEQQANELCASSGFSPRICYDALAQSDWNTERAERVLEERQLNGYCTAFGTTAEDFARERMSKPLSEISDAGLQVLILSAKK